MESKGLGKVRDMNFTEQQPDLGKQWVEVLGVTASGLVQFGFYLGFRDLCVELLMPEDVFAQFCRKNQVEHIQGRAPTSEFVRLARHYPAPPTADTGLTAARYDSGPAANTRRELHLTGEQ